MEKRGDDESTLVDSRCGKSPSIAYVSVRQNDEIRRDHDAETSRADVNGAAARRSKQQEADYEVEHSHEYGANGAEHFGVVPSSDAAAPKGFFYSQDSLWMKIVIGVFGVAMFALILYAMAAAGDYLEYKENGVNLGKMRYNAS